MNNLREHFECVHRDVSFDSVITTSVMENFRGVLWKRPFFCNFGEGFLLTVEGEGK